MIPAFRNFKKGSRPSHLADAVHLDNPDTVGLEHQGPERNSTERVFLIY